MNRQQTTSRERCYVSIILNLALSLMLLAAISTIFWGVDRSLSMADEGLYLLAARYPDEIRQNVSSVYIYTGYLFQIAGFDPTTFRVLGVILVCMSAYVFWMGFHKFLFEFHLKNKTAKTKYSKWYLLLFIELGALLQYQWFYLTPSYNTLIAVAINTSVGSVLYGFSKIADWQRNKAKVFLSFIFAGMGIALAVLTKFPAGFLLLILYFFVVASWVGIKLNQKLQLLIAVWAGILFWFSGHFLLVQSPQIWWQMFKEGWILYQAFGAHVPQNKSLIYINDLWFFVYSALRIYWPCYLLIFAIYSFYILRRNNRILSDKYKFLMSVTAMVGSILLSAKAGINIDERKVIDGSISFYLLFHLGWIFLLLTLAILDAYYKSICFGHRKLINVNVNIGIVLGLLVALPIAGSVGTSNPLYSVPLCYASTWFGAILILLNISSFGERHNAKLKLLGALSIGAFTTSQIIQGYVFDPQGIARNLLQQVEVTSVGFPAKSLKLDSPTHQLVKELSSIAKANGFHPGDDIIAISYIPGLVYAMGGRSPGHPTFLVGPMGLIEKERVEDYSRHALQYADIERLKNAFVLLDVESTDVKLLLASRGLDFPNGYKRVGVSVCSGVNFSLWKPINSSFINSKGN
jgi:hypothetical protein